MNKEELHKPLGKSAVKERIQAGVKLSYIESHHAIREANRVFDFDGWNRETGDLSPVQLEQIEGKWRVGYICKATVTVGSVVRQGTGFGQGIDRDLGRAHESAAKEAESDAMKRALMTFGDIFGLALYDKTQANVEDDTKAPKQKAVTETKEPNEDRTIIKAASTKLSELVGPDEAKAFWQFALTKVSPTVLAAKIISSNYDHLDHKAELNKMPDLVKP
jgi:DNA recombination protein Rad52